MRYLTRQEILDIAEYLNGQESLEIALSELGYDPGEYPEMEDWLDVEAGMIQDPDTEVWYYA
jgi:hypothetical protein